MKCPFCGGSFATVRERYSRPSYEESGQFRGYALECDGCHAQGPLANVPIDAKIEWEKRDA